MGQPRGPFVRRARLAKARPTPGSRIRRERSLRAHGALSQLTAVTTNTLAPTARPFMALRPLGTDGLGSYAYSANTAAGTFTITSSGDGTSVSLPRRLESPREAGKVSVTTPSSC